MVGLHTACGAAQPLAPAAFWCSFVMSSVTHDRTERRRGTAVWSPASAFLLSATRLLSIGYVVFGPVFIDLSLQGNLTPRREEFGLPGFVWDLSLCRWGAQCVPCRCLAAKFAWQCWWPYGDFGTTSCSLWLWVWLLGAPREKTFCWMREVPFSHPCPINRASVCSNRELQCIIE